MYLSFRAKCQIFLPDCNPIWNSSKDFHTSIKFHLPVSLERLANADGQMDGRTDNLIPFRSKRAL
jgi:hypothetical protein